MRCFHGSVPASSRLHIAAAISKSPRWLQSKWDHRGLSSEISQTASHISWFVLSALQEITGTPYCRKINLEIISNHECSEKDHDHSRAQWRGQNNVCPGISSEGGHNVPEHVVRRRFDAGLKSFHNTFCRMANSWALYDNSGPAPHS